MRGKVAERKDEVEGLVGERKRIREQMQIGRQLLEIEQRIGELEQRLMLPSARSAKPQTNGADPEQSESDEDSEEEAESDGLSIPRLRRHMEQYLTIEKSIAKIGDTHPFLVKQAGRMISLKQTVILDLNNALKQASTDSEEVKDDVLKLLDMYQQLKQESEAIKVIRESKLDKR